MDIFKQEQTDNIKPYLLYLDSERNPVINIYLLFLCYYYITT